MKYLFFTTLLMCTALRLFGIVSESILPLMETIDEQHPEKLRVMTYNMLYNVQSAEAKLPVKHHWEYRRPRLLEYLAFAQADIIGSQELQEDQVQDMMRALGPSYAYYGLKTRENEGRSDTNAIFFNPHRLNLIDAQTIFYRDPKGQNAFTYCYFKDLLTGNNLNVVNTKLSWGFSWNAMKRRKAETLQLSQFIHLLPPDEPVILMGDFNTIPFLDGNSIDNILAANNLKDARNQSFVRHLGPLCSSTHSWFFTPFAGPKWTSYIPDRIFINERVEVFAHGIDPARVNGEFPSDHLPVVIDLSRKL